MNPEILQRLNSQFAEDTEQPAILLAYLFGSRASGRTGPQSDNDFAVLLASESQAPRIYSMRHALSELLGTDRDDLVVLNRAPVELRYNVVSSGLLLYETSRAVRIEFEANTLSLYFDYLPVLRRQRRELLSEDDYETGIQRYRAALGKTEKLLAETRTS